MAQLCRAIAAAFCHHCALRFVCYYLLLLKANVDRLLEDILAFGMATFSNDIVERFDRFLK